MNIYVATSWRNPHQPEAVRRLRELGHTVYDFRAGGDGYDPNAGPGGFSWKQVVSDVPLASWTPKLYLEAIRHPVSREGFLRDLRAVAACDVLLYIMPCGVSASMEMGFAVGRKKPVMAWVPAMRDPDLMVAMASAISEDWDDVESFLRGEIMCPCCGESCVPKSLLQPQVIQ